MKKKVTLAVTAVTLILIGGCATEQPKADKDSLAKLTLIGQQEKLDKLAAIPPNALKVGATNIPAQIPAGSIEIKNGPANAAGAPVNGSFDLTAPVQFIAMAGQTNFSVPLNTPINMVASGTWYDPNTKGTYTYSGTMTGTLKLTLPPPPPPPSSIPKDAIDSGILDGNKNWKWNHDPGTPGTSTGSSSYPIVGWSTDNAARSFLATYTSHGGEIFHLSFANDANATHFVYDTNLYIYDVSTVQNVEMDMNQVTSNGNTVIFGMQCAAGTGTWEYTKVANGHTHWYASNLPCNPQKWTPKTYHHIQIASHRDNNGVVTFDWINFDGKTSNFVGATGPSSLSLGWAKADLLLNFQLDGATASAGTIQAYNDKMRVWRW